MPAIVIHHPLSATEKQTLSEDFPYFSFSEGKMQEMEIFFGASLTPEEFEAAPLLRWIHLPSPSANSLPLENIRKRGNILVTFTPLGGIENHGEWAIASLLTLLKGFLSYREADTPLIEPLSLSGKTWLEVPIEGQKSLSNAKFAKKLGLKVIGLQKEGAFAPFADRTYPYKNFHTLLPSVDILSMTTEPRTDASIHLQKEELSLLKKDAILILSTQMKRIDETELASKIEEGYFQGVAIDTLEETPLQRLKNHPRLLITPGISSLPLPLKNPSLSLFRSLLRDYAHDNFIDMKPRVTLD